MFYDNLQAACERNGVKMTPIVKEVGGATGSISTWKKGAYPNSDLVVKLAARLNVSTDFLLTGKEATNMPPDQQELVIMWSQLTPDNRAEARGFIKGLLAAGGAKAPGNNVIPWPISKETAPADFIEWLRLNLEGYTDKPFSEKDVEAFLEAFKSLRDVDEGND